MQDIIQYTGTGHKMNIQKLYITQDTGTGQHTGTGTGHHTVHRYKTSYRIQEQDIIQAQEQYIIRTQKQDIIQDT